MNAISLIETQFLAFRLVQAAMTFVILSPPAKDGFMSTDGELWSVKLANGDVHRVTLDQIDETFNAGRIDGNVWVMAPGSTQWTRLSELAGLDGPPAASPPAAAPPVSTPSQSPPATAYTPYAPYVSPPNSVRPITVDVGAIDYHAAAQFRSGSRKRLVLAAVGAAVAIGGVAFAASQSGGGTDSTPSVAAAAVAPPPAMTIPPATTPTADSTSDTKRLTEAQKQKLLESDKQLENKMKARDDSRSAGTPAPRSAPAYKSQGFTTGGAKGDPLSASF